MIKNSWLVVCSVMTFLIWGQQAYGQDETRSVSIEHAQGKLSLSETPSRVVTFDLASLDTLDALNVNVLALPTKSVHDRLAKYSGKPYVNAGSLFEPDYETVAALEPDLVIVATRSSPSFKMLNSIAPTIDLSVWGEGFIEQFKDRSSTLAKIFARQSLYEKRLKGIEHKIAQVRSFSKDAGKALIILTNGGKISAYGPGSRFGWLHYELGFSSVLTSDDPEQASNIGTHGDPVSFEFIHEANPAWLFVVDRDAAVGSARGAARALLDNPIIKRTQAYQSGQIVYLNPMNWYVIAAGLNAVDESVTEVLEALQKSVSQK
ncbi:periplasmic binding protein [Oleiphilus messinensis]|uniref:Periplasmic binding protein n=1 Tax=Oleiphilus messinensis TaxID=141451 RepID=A0A1Y0I343_9GAMM|nr:ABC transporter substrate-binding protein [Oleiphilus messinensis]ARU54629.1 periplasmic binding protein [Oleiphilus messinensis]